MGPSEIPYTRRQQTDITNDTVACSFALAATAITTALPSANADWQAAAAAVITVAAAP